MLKKTNNRTCPNYNIVIRAPFWKNNNFEIIKSNKPLWIACALNQSESTSHIWVAPRVFDESFTDWTTECIQTEHRPLPWREPERLLASHRVALRCAGWCRVVSCGVVSCRVVWCGVVSCRVMLCCVVSCRVVSVFV